MNFFVIRSKKLKRFFPENLIGDWVISINDAKHFKTIEEAYYFNLGITSKTNWKNNEIYEAIPNQKYLHIIQDIATGKYATLDFHLPRKLSDDINLAFRGFDHWFHTYGNYEKKIMTRELVSPCVIQNTRTKEYYVLAYVNQDANYPIDTWVKYDFPNGTRFYSKKVALNKIKELKAIHNINDTLRIVKYTKHRIEPSAWPVRITACPHCSKLIYPKKKKGTK